MVAIVRDPYNFHSLSPEQQIVETEMLLATQLNNKRADQIEKMFKKLPEEQKQVVKLRFGLDDGEAKGYRKIAQIMHHSVRWVKARLKSAIAILQENFDKLPGEFIVPKTTPILN